MAALIGTWTIDRTRSDDLAKYFLETGISQEVVDKLKPNENQTTFQDLGNGRYRNIIKAPGQPETVSEFSLGEQYDVVSPFGLTFKTTIVDNGNNKFTETSIHPNGNTMVTVREVDGNECKVTRTTEGKVINLTMVKV